MMITPVLGKVYWVPGKFFYDESRRVLVKCRLLEINTVPDYLNGMVTEYVFIRVRTSTKHILRTLYGVRDETR